MLEGDEMSHLIVLRHGETDHNQEGRYCGSMDVDLNATGVAQAKQLASRLPWMPHIDQIVTSGLKRALHTAQIVNQAYNKPLTTMGQFNERNVGVYQGLTQREVQEQYPDYWARNVLREYDCQAFGGESIREVQERVCAGMTILASRFPGQNILLVTHGFISRIIHGHLMQVTSMDVLHQFRLGNCEWRSYSLSNI